MTITATDALCTVAVICAVVLTAAAADLIRAIAEHRRAQADSVLHHAGLLTDSAEDNIE